jgi:class 3 adenylate cyclase/tetratricopeptide (TPR) repeat protein
MTEREQLELAIITLEAQRALLGDVVVNAALAPMREKLAALNAPAPDQPRTSRETQQRKQVTVLFADVSGFTAMSELMDPEEVSTTMNALWLRLDSAIIAYGGRIDKHIGDAVMALWGAPTAREDDPEQAIRAALAMLGELTAFNETPPWAQAGFTAPERPINLQMRIGINTGPALLGQVGITGEYTAMGDAVNVASRLEHAAPVGGILISHDTYRHVRGVFDVLPQAPLAVKGKAERVQTYVVRSAKPRAFRVTTRGVEGIETRTIGREVEMRRLQSAMQTVLEESKTHLVSIVAEAGTGKSRLIYEFGNWLDLLPDSLTFLRGRAVLERATLPYALIRDMLSSRFGIRDSDRAVVARDKLEQGFQELVSADPSEALMYAHFIGHLIGFDFSGSPHLQGILGDARQIRDRAFHYAAQTLAALTRRGPVVVFLEDIHWADAGSLDLMDQVMAEQPALPLLVIGATRSTLFEHRPQWGQGPMQHIRLDLQPLSDYASRQLVEEILRKAPQIPKNLQDLIVNRAEGSPFYVEELIKMLIEDGVIVTGEEHWDVRPDRLAAVRVPATLTGILQARLDGLPLSERETLQQASVVGRVFWDQVVERILNPEVPQAEPSTRVHERLGALSGKELIFPHETSAFDRTNEYIFKHAILHDVTYESVLKRMRRTYHAQVAQCLIELSGERAAEYAGRIGEHYEQAGEWALAAEWYGRAGRQAQDTYAPEVAITYYQKALKFWKESGATPGTKTPPLFPIYEGLGDMLVIQARYAEAIETYRLMGALAEAAGERVTQARAWCGLAMAQASEGDNRGALESASKGEALARSAQARTELAKALLMKGRSAFRLGEAETALALCEEMLAITTETGDQLQMARSLNMLGSIHNIAGRYPQAEDCYTRALTICQELSDRRQVMNLLNNLGVVAYARGDYQTAFERYQEALNIAREIGERDGEIVFLSNLGEVRLRLGEFQAAEADLSQVIDLAGSANSEGLSDTYQILAEACLGQGKIEEALTAARQALTLGSEAGVQAFIGGAWRTLGVVAAHPDFRTRSTDFKLYEAFPHLKPDNENPPSEATACFVESLRICKEMGMEGEQARTLREWAKYELTQGDPAHGAAMWQEARDLFARLGVELEVERMAQLPTSAT